MAVTNPATPIRRLGRGRTRRWAEQGGDSAPFAGFCTHRMNPVCATMTKGLAKPLFPKGLFPFEKLLPSILPPAHGAANWGQNAENRSFRDALRIKCDNIPLDVGCQTFGKVGYRAVRTAGGNIPNQRDISQGETARCERGARWDIWGDEPCQGGGLGSVFPSKAEHPLQIRADVPFGIKVSLQRRVKDMRAAKLLACDVGSNAPFAWNAGGIGHRRGQAGRVNEMCGAATVIGRSGWRGTVRPGVGVVR